MRWRANGALPANAAQITVASKCTPSAPCTCARAPGRPCSIKVWIVRVSIERRDCGGREAGRRLDPGVGIPARNLWASVASEAQQLAQRFRKGGQGTICAPIAEADSE